MRGFMVSLLNKEVRIYVKQHLMSVITMEDALMSIHFGCIGRETHALVGVTVNGGCVVKYLKQTAALDPILDENGPPASQDLPLPLPRKTKMYAESIERESKDAAIMYKTFQRDLVMLRLTTMRAYVKSLTEASSPVTVSSATVPHLQMDVEVSGIGPGFTLRMSVQNLRNEVVTKSLFLSVFADPSIYRIQPSLQHLPALVQGVVYVFEVQVEHVHPTVMSDTVEITLSEITRTSPLIVTPIMMPAPQLVFPVDA